MDQGIQSMEVLDIMRSTPAIFLDEALAHRAYEDVALPIGHNQTISQLRGCSHERGDNENGHHEQSVEIGTGCGYQTAVIAQLAERSLQLSESRRCLSVPRKICGSLDCAI